MKGEQPWPFATRGAGFVADGAGTTWDIHRGRCSASAARDVAAPSPRTGRASIFECPPLRPAASRLLRILAAVDRAAVTPGNNRAAAGRRRERHPWLDGCGSPPPGNVHQALARPGPTRREARRRPAGRWMNCLFGVFHRRLATSLHPPHSPFFLWQDGTPAQIRAGAESAIPSVHAVCLSQ